MNNKLEQLVIKYLNKFYGNLDKHILEEYPGSVFFTKNNIVCFEQDINYRSLYVDRASIWADLEVMFDLEEFDIKCIVYTQSLNIKNLDNYIKSIVVNTNGGNNINGFFNGGDKLSKLHKYESKLNNLPSNIQVKNSEGVPLV